MMTSTISPHREEIRPNDLRDDLQVARRHREPAANDEKMRARQHVRGSWLVEENAHGVFTTRTDETSGHWGTAR